MDRVLLEKLIANPLYGAAIASFVKQQEKGLEKYGSLLMPDKFSMIEYIEHAQQEMIDGFVYLEGIKQHLQQQKEPSPSFLDKVQAELPKMYPHPGAGIAAVGSLPLKKPGYMGGGTCALCGTVVPNLSAHIELMHSGVKVDERV